MPHPAKKKGPKKVWVFNDFRVITTLPERLARYLRELLHLGKAEWDFCLDKVRQYKQWQEAKKLDANLAPLPEKERLYREKSFSKGPGKGRRYIAAPCDELKVVQKAIELQFLKQISVHFCSHGNQEGSSILTNARRHANFATCMFSVDIINAFPSVFRSRVHANLKKPFVHRLRQFSGMEFSQGDIDLMLDAVCDLLCLRDRLPQGPPTSPRVMAIVCTKMTMDLWGLCEKHSSPFQSYRVTVYADNITVSSNDAIPEELQQQILAAVRANGFIPHTRADKTKYYSPATGEVPVITGLVINPDGRITMAPGKKNQFRATLSQLLKQSTWKESTSGQVAGCLGYIRQVYPTTIPSQLRELVKQCTARLAAMRIAFSAPKAKKKNVSGKVSGPRRKPVSKDKKPKKRPGSKGTHDFTPSEIILPLNGHQASHFPSETVALEPHVL